MLIVERVTMNNKRSHKLLYKLIILDKKENSVWIKFIKVQTRYMKNTKIQKSNNN